MRVFAALVPPLDVVEDLDAFLEVRREHGAFRWTDPEHLHLTLAFCADLPDHRLEDLVEAVGEAASRRTPVGVRLAGGGAFPHAGAAKVLWTGLSGTDEGLEEVAALARGCRSAANRVGGSPDGQAFRPHVTLARLGRPQEVSRWVRLLDAYHGPDWTADTVSVVVSHLGEGRRGRPRHEVVAEVALGG